jgi:hypothetical protein
MALRVETCRFLRELVVTDVGRMLPYAGASAETFLRHVDGGGSVDAPSKAQLGRWLKSPPAAFWGVVSCHVHQRTHYYKTNPSLARVRLQDCPMMELTEPRGATLDSATRSESSATEPSAPASTSSTSSRGATRSHEDAIAAGETPVGRGNREPDDIIMIAQGADGSNSDITYPARSLFRFVLYISIYA